jgi:DNA (cytosine-5)-methyltransferase 1
MNVVGLFAGIGGLETGFARAGHRTSLLCEIDERAVAVLRARVPDVPRHADVRELSDLPADTDVVTAGFPCQDLSQAGRTQGIDGLRSSLVGEVFRLLSRSQVPTVVLENVPFMLHLQRGRALDHVLTALEDLGYRWAYRVVDTRAFGLPQRRERVYIVGSRVVDPADVLLSDEAAFQAPVTAIGQIAHGFYWTEGTRGLGWAPDGVPTLKNGSTVGIPSPPAILLPDGRIVQPDIRDAERLQGFEPDWTRPAEAVSRASARWSLVGNAVSVPVAEWIGRRLSDPGRFERSRDLPIDAGAGWGRAGRLDGRDRRRVSVSVAPVSVPAPALHEFLLYPGRPLSVRATSGFLSRARASSLRFAGGFLDAVEMHLRRQSTSEPRVTVRAAE